MIMTLVEMLQYQREAANKEATEIGKSLLAMTDVVSAAQGKVGQNGEDLGLVCLLSNTPNMETSLKRLVVLRTKIGFLSECLAFAENTK